MRQNYGIIQDERNFWYERPEFGMNRGNSYLKYFLYVSESGKTVVLFLSLMVEFFTESILRLLTI